MKKNIKFFINLIGTSLFILVLADHFTGFTYNSFLKGQIHADISLYIEMVSLLFTISVPFFYSLYKRRENQLEEDALQKGGTAEDLKNIRQQNDFKSILYYSLMVFFVVLLAFIQSNIIIAGREETSILEAHVVEIQKNLKETINDLDQMNQQLVKLDSVLSIILEGSGNSNNLQKLNAALENLNDIRTLTENIQKSVDDSRKAASERQIANVPSPLNINEGRLKNLQDEISKFKELFVLFEKAVMESSSANYENISKKIDDVKKEIQKFKNSTKPYDEPNSSDLAQKDKNQLKNLIAKYYDDFKATQGAFKIPENNDQKLLLLEKVNRYFRSRGMSKEKVKKDLLDNIEVIKTAQKLSESEKNFWSNRNKTSLNWLVWLSNNFN